MPPTRSGTSAGIASSATVDVSTASDELAALVRGVREHPGLLGKSAIELVSDVFGPSDWLRGPGDDGAAVPLAGTNVVACGEALWPPFVAADPFGSGVAAVLTNVNDLAAMGATPLGIVDTIVADDALARRVLEGMRYACEIYAVPLLGGHLTRHDGAAVGLRVRARLYRASALGRQRPRRPAPRSRVRDRGRHAGGLPVLPVLRGAGREGGR